MSNKIYNEKTGDWVKTSTMLASSSKVLDLSGNFKSKNVEGCLSEIKEDMKEVHNKLQYIYENGTMGGGGGGGGSLPVVKLLTADYLICSTDETIEIMYQFTSPNPGNGTACLTIDNSYTEVECYQGRPNRWIVGPFEERKEYRLSVSVIDRAGLSSSPAMCTVMAGALELTSSFDDQVDYSVSDHITIPYTIESINSDPVSVDITIDGETRTEQGIIGNNTLNVGQFSVLGLHTVSIQAKNSTLQSNILKYNIIVADADSLYMSSGFDREHFNYGNRVLIDYRISKKGYSKFKTKCFIDGREVAEVSSKSKDNLWDVGTELTVTSALEPHILELVSIPYDGNFDNPNDLSNRLSFRVWIESDDKPTDVVSKGLIAAFSADGKMNESSDRATWVAKPEGSGVSCSLHNFNYKTNGWKDGALNFMGKTYAKMNLSPLAQNIPNGFTFEVCYKVENVGSYAAKVVHCRRMNTPYQGFDIDTAEATFNSVASKMVVGKFKENEWVRQTFVVDREKKVMILYTNAVLSSIAFLDSYEDFSLDKQIILGAGIDDNGNIIDNSCSSIKTIRVYGRALTHEEVLQNHIADQPIEVQKELKELNFGTEGLPVVRITGDVTNIDSEEYEKPVEFVYTDPKNPLKAKTFNCKISIQGTSSKSYPVQNYTVKLFEGNIQNDSWTPNDNWLPEFRYTLKADFMESSHANNVGTAKYVHDFFKDKYYASNPYPSFATDPLHRASIDGYPIEMYVNGDYKGIYMFNIDRYAHNTYGYIGEPKCVSYEVSVNSETGAGAFADDSWESISSEFKYRYSYHGDINKVTEKTDKNEVILSAGYHDELQQLVTWVKHCTDAEFRNDLEKHFSKKHLIDYFLIVYVMGLIDSLGKNMVLTTWGANQDLDVIWYPSFYDMDTMLGLSNDGQLNYGPEIDTEGKYGENGDYNTSNSLLWTKLRRNFNSEIAARYRDLRATFFNAETLLSYYEGEVINKIGQYRYNVDAHRKYIDLDKPEVFSYCCQGTRLEYTRRWLQERFIYLDTVFYTDDYTRKKAVIRSNTTDNLVLGMRAHSPQWVDISWSNNALHKSRVFIDKWNKNDPDGIYWIDGGPTNNPKENNIDINGAPGIMYLYGLENMEVSTILVGEAEKLVELDCGSSKHLKQLQLGSNRLLQKVNCKDCENLGTSQDAQGKQLNVRGCTNLKHLDVSGTKLTGVLFPEEGGSLEFLDVSNTRITSFTLVGQEYLESANLSQCRDLSRFTLNGCNAMTTIAMPNSKLEAVSITDCNALKNLDISYTGFLKTLDLSGCENLEVLNLSGITGSSLTEVDLSYCNKLKDLKLTGSGYIRNIIFPREFSTLKSLNCESSGIRAFKYGVTGSYPNYLDLGNDNRINLEYMNFKNCPELIEIRNCNYTTGTGKSSAFLFYSCKKLTTIHGSLTLKGDISEAFRSCEQLVNLPATFNLNNVTGGNYIFSNCKKFTWTHVQKIFDSCTSLTSTNEMFSGCTGIVGAIPANLFAKSVKITTLSEMFSGCYNITGSIPRTLLHPLKNFTSGYYGFYGCSGLTGPIPNELFQIPDGTPETQAKNITNIEYMFQGCSNLTDLEPGVLANMKKLSNARCFLYNCSKIDARLNSRFFVDCTNLSLANHFFANCRMLNGTIPAGLFNGLTKLSNVSSFFNGCRDLEGSIPTNLFTGAGAALQYIDSFFNGCSGLTGDIPEQLLAANSGLINAAYLFSGCTGLGPDIPGNLFKGKTRLTDVSYVFNGCRGLSGHIPAFETVIETEIEIEKQLDEFGDLVEVEVPVDYEITKSILDGCTGLLKASGMFAGCEFISGTIPSGLFYSTGKMTHINNLFDGCKGLLSPIPPRLFKNCGSVTDMTKIFYYCERIYGGIPKQLFNKCVSLTKLDDAFLACFALREDDTSLPAIPEQLFENCKKLVSLKNTFYWNGLRGHLMPDTFYSCSNLENISGIFAHTGSISGPLPDGLFRRNRALKNCYEAFRSCSITSLPSDLFKNSTQITNFKECFSGCGGLTGDYIKTWVSHPNATHEKIYAGCTKLTGYAEMPGIYK